MRIFLYEFVTGGGCYSLTEGIPQRSLWLEGRAMLAALAADFGRMSDVRSLDLLSDARSPLPQLAACTVHCVESRAEEQRVFQQLAAGADWTLVVAPEFANHLLLRVQAVETAGGRLLGPGTEFVALATDKQLTAERLSTAGVSVPQGIALPGGAGLPQDFDYPAVLKPRDGAGSIGVRRVERPEVSSLRAPGPSRLEVFCPGTSASVVVLCGPGKTTSLVPCQQLLDDFVYCGGKLPIAPQLAERAVRLAVRAVRTLGPALGYVGVDLVLGNDPGGAEDFVIEVNPRVTTSYVGLRAAAQTNLAEAMLAIARGDSFELCWHSRPIQFETSGAITTFE